MLDLVTDETLAARGDEMAQPTIARVMEEEGNQRSHGNGAHTGPEAEWTGYGPPPDVDAETSIPQEWRTIDRVLDVMLLPPAKAQSGKKKSKKGNRILSASASPVLSDDAAYGTKPNNVGQKAVGGDPASRPDGLEPEDKNMIEVDEWERKTMRELTEDDADEVAPFVTWCFVSRLAVSCIFTYEDAGQMGRSSIRSMWVSFLHFSPAHVQK